MSISFIRVDDRMIHGQELVRDGHWSTRVTASWLSMMPLQTIAC